MTIGVSVVASGGKWSFAPAAPLLTSVIPFAATGFRLSAAGIVKPGHVIAGYDARANADFFAPGVNVCLNAAQTFRCDTAGSAVLPDTLGATGSSFAAPIGTGLSALCLRGADLRGCSANSLGQDVMADFRYATDGSDFCR